MASPRIQNRESLWCEYAAGDDQAPRKAEHIDLPFGVISASRGVDLITAPPLGVSLEQLQADRDNLFRMFKRDLVTLLFVARKPEGGECDHIGVSPHLKRQDVFPFEPPQVAQQPFEVAGLKLSIPATLIAGLQDCIHERDPDKHHDRAHEEEPDSKALERTAVKIPHRQGSSKTLKYRLTNQ